MLNFNFIPFQFATALERTKKFILSLIGGTAKYADIFLVQTFNAEKEFKILCGFPEFRGNEEGNEEGKEGIKHMLELFEYLPQISVIPDVCSQYQCVNDPKLNELVQIINSVKTQEIAEMTGQIATNTITKIWDMLRFRDSSVAKKCLGIFPAVASCVEFYQFIKKKGFISKRTVFISQVQLITIQLQHEQYNEAVLNHLMPAFKYIGPFLDTGQSLAELMDKIVKLCSESVGSGCDPSKKFCQLETVNSNITMIQQWFSKAEVRIYSCNYTSYVSYYI